uniref:VP5 n=1 Tax=Gierle tick virus TaxID=2867436 RepID=A0A8G0QGE4_9REOV|nr:VP5 [Gierle tick virus]
MSTTQAVIYLYPVPTDCVIDVIVRDPNGQEIPDVSVRGYASRGNVIVNGKKTSYACDLNESISVLRSGALTVVERVTARLCDEGDTDALQNVLDLINRRWPHEKEQDAKAIWANLMAYEAGTFNRLTMIEHKTDWVAATTAATWQLLIGMWTAMTANGLLGPVKDENGSLVDEEKVRRLGGGLLYDNEGDVSTLVYSPLSTRLLRFENGAMVVSEEPKKITGIVPAGSVPFVASVPLMANQVMPDYAKPKMGSLPSSSGVSSDSSRAPTPAQQMPITFGDFENAESCRPPSVEPARITSVMKALVEGLNSAPEEVKKEIAKQCEKTNLPPPTLSYLDAARAKIDAKVSAALPPHQRDHHRKTIVDDGRKPDVIVTPDYHTEGTYRNLQPYHSYGHDGDDHHILMGVMKNRRRCDTPIIPMPASVPSQCGLFVETSNFEKPNWPVTLACWTVDVEHIEKRECYVHHQLANGDGSRLECMYEFLIPDLGESVCLQVDSFKEPTGGVALFGKAVEHLQRAIGMEVIAGRFLLFRTRDFDCRFLPADVVIPKTWDTKVRSRGVRHLLTVLENWILSHAPETFSRLATRRAVVRPKPEEDLISRLENAQIGTKFGEEKRPDHANPTTLPRILQSVGAGKWATVVDDLSKAAAEGTARDGFSYDAIYDAMGRMDQASSMIAQSLLNWRSRAVNHIPRICMKAVGVSNGFKLSPNQKLPKQLMSLNKSEICDGGMVCPECGSVYATVAERQICSVVDFIVHHATALNNGYVVGTDLRVYSGQLAHSVFQVKPKKEGWDPDWCKYRVISAAPLIGRVVKVF